jgi:hypothetical protein
VSAHWQHCESEGLQCPQEVFTQLFSGKAHDEDFAVIVRSVDWGRVRWELQEVSGIALRHVRVAREYQHALDRSSGGGLVRSYRARRAALELQIGCRLGNLLALRAPVSIYSDGVVASSCAQSDCVMYCDLHRFPVSEIPRRILGGFHGLNRSARSDRQDRHG